VSLIVVSLEQLIYLWDTGLVKNKNQSKMKKRVFFIFFPLVFNMEGTDTGWMSVLEKKWIHQAAGLLENYGIDSETDVSLLDQGDLRNLVSQGLKPMQLKKLEHWCESVRARAEKTLPSSLNTPTAAALLSSEALNVLTLPPP
jgi:hypothetical protein